MEEAATRGSHAAVGFALLAAVTLDGVPENLALGVSLLSGGGSIVLLVAIFCSNFPEALVGAVAMRRGGRSALFAIGIWSLSPTARRLSSGPAQSPLDGPLAFEMGGEMGESSDSTHYGEGANAIHEYFLP